MRSSLVLALVLVAACGGDDDYQPPPVIGSPDAAPDAIPPPDADPTAIDALLSDASGNDGKGPVIELVAPERGELVSGTMRLTVTITDAHMVDPTSVKATITGVTLADPIEMLSSGVDQWSGIYDTVPLAGRVFPEIIVMAKDDSGNETRLGFEITLDNNPPLIELDPPRVREIRRDQDVDVCSDAFDPVGEDAVDDLDPHVRQLFEIRARIEDQSNLGYPNSAVLIPLAGVDDPTVELFILDDTSQPLVVDTTISTDPQRICDDINPKVIARQSPRRANEALLVHLVPLEGAGASRFRVSPQPPLGTNVCRSVLTEADPPRPLCESSDEMTRIATVSGRDVPMIYTVPPAPPDDEEACVGFALDSLAANIADGWACAAVRAYDKLGNRGVSPPIRICIDKSPGGPDPCAGMPAPDCVGSYDLASGMVNDTPCSLIRTDPELLPPGLFFPRFQNDFELIRI